jgi:hypothetical protein
VQEHDGQEFAALGEDKGDIVDVLETCVAKGRSQGRSDCNQEQGEEDLFRGKDWRDLARASLGIARRRGDEVDEACDCGEGGLYRVEEYGILEACIGRAVSGSSETFLEVGPAQTVAVISCALLHHVAILGISQAGIYASNTNNQLPQSSFLLLLRIPRK